VSQKNDGDAHRLPPKGKLGYVFVPLPVWIVEAWEQGEMSKQRH
jgi:hypothetical protein